MARQCWPIHEFWLVLYYQSTFIGFKETSGYWSGVFLLFNMWEVHLLELKKRTWQ